MLSAEEAAPLREAAEAADRVLAGVPAGRIDDLAAPLASTLATVRDAAGACAAQVRAAPGEAQKMPNAWRRGGPPWPRSMT